MSGPCPHPPDFFRLGLDYFRISVFLKLSFRESFQKKVRNHFIDRYVNLRFVMLLLTNCNAIQKLQFLAKGLLRQQLKKDKGLGP